MSAVAVTFPLALGRSGDTRMEGSRTAAAEQLIEELLFTNPGERLNRPTMGSGLIELIFDALTEELRTATQFQVQSNLQQWLGDLIRVVSVVADGTGSELEVTVTYQLAGDAATRAATFRR